MTCIYEGFYLKKDELDIQREEGYAHSLIAENKMVYTNQIKSDKVVEAIQTKLGEDVYKHVLYAFFSEAPDIGGIIFRFLKMAFKLGGKCLEYRAHKSIEPLLKQYGKVTREAHHMLGLTRFMELDNGILYAQYESTTNVLYILASHFLSRLGGECWVLHDMKRHQAAICDGQNWLIEAVEVPESITLHEREVLFQELWKTYFHHVTIQSRKNLNLQRQNMPKKYWKYLVEKMN
jgi:probable DNA metabolism protein